MSSINFTINENSPQISQPKKIKITLKPHQLAMIHTMLELEKKKKINILESNSVYDEERTFETDFGALCDKVGSGKSYIILGLIAHKKLLDIREKCIYSYGSIIREYSKYKFNLPINLLVLPHGIINQWEKYILENTSLKSLFLKNLKDMKNFKNKIDDYKVSLNTDYFNFDIICITSPNYNRLSEFLENVSINRLFVDEVETIKIPASKKIRSEFTWFISSSIKILQNPKGVYVMEEYGYVNYLGNYTIAQRRTLKEKMSHIGYLKDTLIDVSRITFRNQVYLKCEDEFVKKSFLLPNIETKIIKCKDNVYTHVLNGLVSTEIMSMINAGDIDSAIEHSGYEQEDEENLVKLLTNDLQNKLNNKNIELQAKEQMTFSSLASKEKSIKKIKDEIAKLEEKISCIKKRVLETEACSICFDKIENRVIVKCCNNPFCYECITLSINSNPSCPLCRTHINNDNLIILKEKTHNCEEIKKTITDEDRTKLENLKIYLKKIMNENHKKILIFSEYEKPLEEIEYFIKSQGYKYNQLKGTSKYIARNVDRYKTNKIDILLLNSKYFGSGLNLENTTHLIMYHKMSDHLDKQVIGRAQRPGRTQPLNLLRFCYSNEL